jgi:hypothetical protein
VRPRLSRNPIPESTAFSIAPKRPENNFFGCPHHKHVTLATLCGLPHAEQTFTCRIEGFFPGGSKLNAPSAQMLPYMRPNACVAAGLGPFLAAEAGARGPIVSKPRTLHGDGADDL